MPVPREPLVLAVAPSDAVDRAPAIAVALALHMALIAAVFAMRPVVPPVAPDVAVSVSLVQGLAAPDLPEEPPVTRSRTKVPGRAPVAVRRGADSDDEMVRPSTMLSERTLSGPRGKEARADLATFAERERMVQLCNVEAMDQISAWDKSYRPERIVAYARSSETVSGNRLDARGAAFRSSQRWYDLRFTCSLAPDRNSVVDFAFHVGAPVPEADWERLGLPGVE